MSQEMKCEFSKYGPSNYLKKSLHNNSNINQLPPESDEPLPPPFRFEEADILTNQKMPSKISTCKENLEKYDIITGKINYSINFNR